MSGIEPAHNFTCYANEEEKYKVSSQDHQTADVVQHSTYYCHWETYDKRQNMFFIKLALLSLKEHKTTAPSRNMLAMLDIPNMFGSWPFITAAEKASKHVFHKSLLLSLNGTQHNSSITELVMPNIPNMLGSWASITAAEKVMISVYTPLSPQPVRTRR